MNYETVAGGPSGLQHIHAIAQEIYVFVSQVQKPRPHDAAWSVAVSTRSRELSEKLGELRESYAPSGSLTRSVERMRKQLHSYAGELEGRPSVRRLKEKCKSLSHAYEDLRDQIRKTRSHEGAPAAAAQRLRPLKPPNYARNAFHVSMGLGGALLYQFVLSYRGALTVLGTLTSIFVSLEISRRIFPKFNDFLVDKVFGLIVRPRERRHVNSATYYLIALTMMTALVQKPAIQLAVLVLAFGDPAATLAGRRWGKRKIWGEKSFAGFAAFFTVSLATALIFLTLAQPQMAFARQLSLGASVSIVGALAELFSDRLDDNFTIPVLCAGLAYFWF